MKRYLGGEAAPSGLYLNLSTVEIVRLNGRTPFLPGEGEVKYLRVPVPLVIVVAPLVGLAFYLFLPAIAIVAVPSLLAYKVGRWGRERLHRTIQPAAVGYSPGKAYFVRKRRPPAEKGTTEGTEEHLKKLGEEIAKRRQKGEE